MTVVTSYPCGALAAQQVATAQRARMYTAKTFPETNLQKGPILSSPGGREFCGGADLDAPGLYHSITKMLVT